MLGFDPGQGRDTVGGFCGRELGMEADDLVAGFGGGDAGQLMKHPGSDRAKSVMREGVHRGVHLAIRSSEAVLLGVGIPALPNRGGAVFNFITP